MTVRSIRTMTAVATVVAAISASRLIAGTEPHDRQQAAAPAAPTMASVMAAMTDADWRPLDPEHTLYLELATGRVVIELAPEFAPAHAANVKALARESYFDGLTINRVQDNYVVQWGDRWRATRPADGSGSPTATARSAAPAATTPTAAAARNCSW